MNHKLSGLYYGVISATMTVIGLVMGLSLGTESKLSIIIAISTMAVSDTLADAFGIFMAHKLDDDKEIDATKQAIYVIASKAAIGLSFLLIFYLIKNMLACQIVSIIFAYSIIVSACNYLAEINKENKVKLISRYTGITTIIVILTIILSKIVKSTLENKI